MTENDGERLLRMLAFLSYSFEVPAPPWVSVTTDNPILVRLALIDRCDHFFESFVHWLESHPSNEALHHLRRDYTRLFVLPDAPTAIHLHRLISDASPEEILQKWMGFLSRVHRKPGTEWHDGQDHLTIVLELLASLFRDGDEQWVPLAESFVLPWLDSFSTALIQNASTPFYRGVGNMAGEVNHALGYALHSYHSDSLQR